VARLNEEEMMKRTFAYGAATRQGAWPVQEDGYFMDPLHGFFVLADGFGGRGNGDLAAKAALLEARTAAGPTAGARKGGAPFRGPLAEWQRGLFLAINKKLLQWNETRAPNSRGGVSLLLVSSDRERQEFTLSHCGACAAFLLRAGARRWLPVLTPQAPPRADAEASLAPDQAVGLGAEIEPETRSVPWQAGDVLFLFSSGLDWEREGFALELVAQAALRAPGSDLLPLVAFAAEGGASKWNQTALAVEALI
jgi:serine/threonine protein phosphatase PrpC